MNLVLPSSTGSASKKGSWLWRWNWGIKGEVDPASGYCADFSFLLICFSRVFCS
jgi:hypothetical protein